MIPNTIHFIYPVTERTRPWSLVNHASVMLARKIHNPDRIVIWTNNEPSFSLKLTASAAKAEVLNIDLSMEFEGVPVNHPQYMSDIIRLQILHAHGGIYLDTDILLRMDLNAHLSIADKHEMLVMSWENASKTSICNALMISPPENPFIAEWMKRIPISLGSSVWAEGGVILPAEIAKIHRLKSSRVILDYSFACPLDLSRPWLFDPDLRMQAMEKIERSHAIHVFETYWRDTVKGVNAEWIEKTPSLFSAIFKEVMGDV